MLSCSVWFSAPNFWVGGGLESRCVGHVYGADGAVRWLHPHRSVRFYYIIIRRSDYYVITLLQDTQVIIGTVLIVKC